MFSVGDKVIYSSTGACEISDIVKNKLTGVLREYYVLNPIKGKQSVVYVPIDNDNLICRMRELPTKKEIKKLLLELKDSSIDWNDNNIDRAQYFHKIYIEGDIRQQLLLFKTLYLRRLELLERGKHLSMSDEKLYKDCQKLLCAEFSVILNINEEEALCLLINK